MALQTTVRQSLRRAPRCLSPVYAFVGGNSELGFQSSHLKERFARFQFYCNSVVSANYEKRNYAKDLNQYTDVLYNLNNANRPFLLRDVYDDMILDGIQPHSDTFVPLLVGCMKGSRLQDAFYFYDEMKCMGYIPDDLSFNCLVATCGRCRQQRRAFQVVEEMKDFGMRPKLKTLTALLGACGYAGLPKEAAGVVQRITESGFTLNKYCYAALIGAEKNQQTKRGDPFEKIMEILKQARSWSSLDMFGGARTPSDIIDEIDEYVYGLPTVDFVRGRPNVVDRKLTVYHAALCACADLKSTAALRSVVEMLRQDGYQPDIFCVAQILRCHVACGEYGVAMKALNGYLNSGRPARTELFSVLIVEAMKGFTREGMEMAKNLLQELLNRGLPVVNKVHSELLELASQEPRGDYSVANLLFDLMQKRQVSLPKRIVELYYRGLQRRQVPEGDPRLAQVTKFLGRRASPRFSGGQRQIGAA
ncbi:hypothetical protein KP509_05G086100 [Ceratopteris richardii]|uniref:PROP1-like PPR domain-containing protein n=1 Tax=Ceratopteris richardii TaxID=49495 RepID=A0A8T2USK6_CERRI|nr:hypothetical protein KP509_05G086100 [Ceratopteris richardii]KAH7437727.1 hypothetical protein KP509_05G086100 [Ceratopteris richardii]KAH7437728.1 hypothetical protein KP509_05G086100 [Ceratopteris richardii]